MPVTEIYKIHKQTGITLQPHAQILTTKHDSDE